MKIAVIGMGYVGLTTAVCLAETGNRVYCVDISEDKINNLIHGMSPIYEQNLEELLKKGTEDSSLLFFNSYKDAIEQAQVIFICIGTPNNEKGETDLVNLFSLAENIAKNLKSDTVIAIKSTVPPGTCAEFERLLRYELANIGKHIHVEVVSNPEFLKEGVAIEDFKKPDRILLGTSSSKAIKIMKNIYAPFNRSNDRVKVLDRTSAELSKYAANAFLATKISFINEMANIAEKVGADIEQVRLAIGSDKRIGYDFIYPGCGFGGSCFPKDIRALIHTALQEDCDPKIMKATYQVNNEQKKLLFSKIYKYFKRDVSGKTFAIWGGAFKPNTDDIRESPALDLIHQLLQNGASIRLYDPKAMVNLQKKFHSEDYIYFATNPEDALLNADALVITTEWNIFRSQDFGNIKAKLLEPLIFDGRNIFNPDVALENGVNYISIGRTPAYRRIGDPVQSES